MTPFMLVVPRGEFNQQRQTFTRVFGRRFTIEDTKNELSRVARWLRPGHPGPVVVKITDVVG